jgi:tRNA 2-thiouridine synthesizing protein A
MSNSNHIKEKIIPDNTVNARELHSPLPLLRLKKELAIMKVEETVRIDCTDSASLDDIESWCVRMNHSFLGEKKEEDTYSYYIKKNN